MFRQIATLVVCIMMIGSAADAALKYQQDVTLTNWKSQECAVEQAQEFCNAAAGDPDIKVISVKYEQEKVNKNVTCYNAIITCHVSKIDEDLARIQGKIFQQQLGLISNADAMVPTKD